MGSNSKSVLTRFRKMRMIVLAVALTISAGLGLEQIAQAQQPQLPTPADLSRTFINVAKQVKPAVVSINVVEKTRRSPSMRMPEGFPQIPGLPMPNTPRRRQGTGSGIIISTDGYIVTNNHVVGDADEITVKLSDGREFKNAKRVGTDPETDLAVIKIDAQSLPHAKLGNSDALEQGEWVIALGSPFGLQQTMTAGIVSALGRDLGPSAGQFTDFIQTDAAINPGNSGGPLINMQGEVVGINTLIFSQTGASSGVGFAIPANLANKVYAQLVKTGKVTRGYLGVLLKPVTPAIARNVGYDKTEGALVDDVTKADSPAAKAGLQSGDVIIEFDGKPVKTPKNLTDMVADTQVGKAVKVQYLRDGRPQTTMITLAERPGADDLAKGEDTPDEEEDGGKLGIFVSEVTPELARQMKLKVASGVVIQNVDSDGPAAEAGIQRGDVIHRVNRTQVSSRQDLVRALAALKNEKDVVLQIERGGQLSFIAVSLE